MPLSLYALDKFVAQELSQLTECRAVPIGPDFPDYESWLTTFVLNWMFRVPIPKDKAALAFTLIRRAEAAIADYEDARADLFALVTGEGKVSLYFARWSTGSLMGHSDNTVSRGRENHDLGRLEAFGISSRRVLAFHEVPSCSGTRFQVWLSVSPTISCTFSCSRFTIRRSLPVESESARV